MKVKQNWTELDGTDCEDADREVSRLSYTYLDVPGTAFLAHSRVGSQQ